MYKVRNKSFDWIFEKYVVERIDDLSDEELLELCLSNKELNTEPQYTTTKKDGKIVSRSFDRYKTIEKLAKNFSIDFYMPDTYWSTRQIESAIKRNVAEEISKHQNGRETFELFKSMGVGLSNFKPGDVALVDWNDRFIREVIAGGGEGGKPHPYFKLLDIEVIEATVDKDITKKVEEMSLDDLKILAKENGLRYIGVNTDFLKQQLIKKLSMT